QNFSGIERNQLVVHVRLPLVGGEYFAQLFQLVEAALEGFDKLFRLCRILLQERAGEADGLQGRVLHVADREELASELLGDLLFLEGPGGGVLRRELTRAVPQHGERDDGVEDGGPRLRRKDVAQELPRYQEKVVRERQERAGDQERVAQGQGKR